MQAIAHWPQPASASPCEVFGLFDRLRPELLTRGLNEAEANALLEVWTGELVGQAGAGDDTRVSHAIYFVSRED